MTTIDLKSGDASRVKADAVVIGVSKRGKGIALSDDAQNVESAYGKSLKKTLSAMGASGKAGQVTIIPAAGAVSATLVVAVGIGDQPDATEGLRRAAGAAVRALAGSKHVVLALPALSAADVGAVAEGALFGSYAFLGYRRSTAADHKTPVAKITIVSASARRKDVTAAVNAAKGGVAGGSPRARLSEHPSV